MGMVKVFYKGAKVGVKYAPVLVAVAKEAQGPATEYAKGKLETSRQKKLAVAKATSVVDGTLLRVPHGEVIVWVVFSGDRPVAEYPDVAVPPETLVADADLGKRRPPEECPRAMDTVGAAAPAAGSRLTFRKRGAKKTTKAETTKAAAAIKDTAADAES